MKQKQFEAEHADLWNEITAILQNKTHEAAPQLPALYRRLCQCLALAGQRGYSPLLTGYLQRLVSDCHRHLYGAAAERPQTLRDWLLQEMPRQVRREWRLLLLALVGFWGVALALGWLVWVKPHWAYAFMSPQQLQDFQAMYQPGKMNLGRGGSESDVMMFGFYIWNNVSIGFRTFAAGLFGGIPALLSIVFNGMHLGVVASWLGKDPATRETFSAFVITHASFEVTGLLLSGLAGMRLGLSLIAPGRLTRRHALLSAARAMFPVIVGAAMLTVLAAFVEAFWSASGNISVEVKYVVGTICWIAVIAFFSLAGRAGR
ncbi:putative membrane protein SpoIIM required for sporulation [Paucimonas lemoignei]|uniref:Putative membrane protein SpoIIM required for sporulation n=1 Tax=Paucimonas lemoignei TaxID=29443 RepID=A0A4R3HYK3_PAULE|nr:stage II sporulation protein M [Paucimonas lemoignei]TCS37391.1 putative membrane protein SpoIIM required for sporulation [Paucimonas lemoignei]